MAITVRQGNKDDFDPESLQSGEWACVVDEKEAHLCFGDGVTRKMATYEEIEVLADSASVSASTASTKASEASTSASTATTKASEASESALSASTSAQTASTKASEASASAQTATTKASEASTSATNAANSASLVDGVIEQATAQATASESWAVGGTGTRTGEDTNNAKYWSEQTALQLSDKADIIKPTVSGANISLEDSSNSELQSIKLYGKSTQSGTPSVETPIPIVDAVNPKITVSNSDNSQTQEVTISGTFRSVNTVADEINSVTGKITRKLGIAVFDGSDDELWENGGRGDKTTYRRFILTKADKKFKCVLLCSHFQYVETSAYVYNGEAICREDSGAARIDIVSTQLDLASWKTWLANNPITVIYELATPIETDISYETLTALRALTTYYPITNIRNDMSCDMEVTYRADTQNYINNKISKLTTAIIALGGTI